MIDGNVPEADGNACNYDTERPGDPHGACRRRPTAGAPCSRRSPGRSQNNDTTASPCRARSGGQFAKEYQIGGQKPYDADYYLDYHRPVCSTRRRTPPTACVIAPGALPGARAGHGRRPERRGLGQQRRRRRAGATDFPRRRHHHAARSRSRTSPRTRRPARAASSRRSSTRRTSTRTARSRRTSTPDALRPDDVRSGPERGHRRDDGQQPHGRGRRRRRPDLAGVRRVRRHVELLPRLEHGRGLHLLGQPRRTATPHAASRSARATRRRRRGKGA